MRRGRPGNSGWRNDNPRHFRPRNGGTPHFRPPRSFGHADALRFPPPGIRPLLGRNPYPVSGPSIDHLPHEPHDRHSYRGKRNQHRPQERSQFPHQGQQRQILPYLQRMRHGDVPDHNTFQDNLNYYDNKKQPWETMNSMGDIDHRQPATITPKRPAPWQNPPFNYENRSPTKAYRHQDNIDHNKIPVQDYTGHRPPASDHYGGSHGSTMDNSNTFSRSVDDTVDIVRKRLLNRDSQPPLESPPLSHNETEQDEETTCSQFSNIQQDQPAKKKSIKLENIKSNCDKIRSKIVHQLFMMDKDKIHKLMDNPNSSTKFEYAISSLVTESQNSYNRHLRSVAEKSLCSSSTEFIHDDNNTIYEDTFMKQMEGIFDPQDTVLLEDIKPMVLAELSKVLQLDDLQLRQEMEGAAYPRNDQLQYEEYTDKCYDDYNNPYSPTEGHDDYNDQKPNANFDKSDNPYYDYVDFSNSGSSQQDSGLHLFERRPPINSSDQSDSRKLSEEKRRKESRNIVSRSDDNLERTSTSIPLFDSNIEQLSDEEDPFAELDRQYHVAVDHNFIENEYVSSPQSSNRSSRALSPVHKKDIPSQVHVPEKPTTRPPNLNINKTPDKPPSKIKEEIENQLLDLAKSPLKFLSPPCKSEPETPLKTPDTIVKEELIPEGNLHNTPATTPRRNSKSNENNESSNVSMNQDFGLEPKIAEVTPEKSDGSVKACTPIDSRKRSIDQKPSHRKEKRKKSESSQQDTANKQILNKNIIIHVSDCTAKSSDKSIFNLYFSKDRDIEKEKKSNKESLKDIKKNESSEKKYSDKYVKRKEKESSCSKKSKDKDCETKKQQDSSTSSHSILSLSDLSNSQNSNKLDSQIKLKPIDMFVEQPKKPTGHLSHRNTAAPITSPKSTPVELKPIVISRKLTKRHIATQVSRKCMSREIQTIESKSGSNKFSQTERKKIMTRGAQTDPVSFKAASKSTDALERMKEIDMEIQALLQEKFKLYSSLESKESCPKTMQSLGMAVLNVIPDSNVDENSVSADTIVDEFTNIPVEELEQIALETVQDERNQQTENRSLSKRKRTREKSQDTVIFVDTSKNTSKKKCAVKAPSDISLDDDTPFEEVSINTTKRKAKRLHSSSHNEQEVINRPTEKTRINTSKKRAAKARSMSLMDQIISEDKFLDDTSSNTSRNKKACKAPNISLIEQIITDDRPLEDIISLDDLEVPTPKKKQKAESKPKKQSSKKKSVRPEPCDHNYLTTDNYDLKPCSVLLKRDDLNKLILKLKQGVPEITTKSTEIIPPEIKVAANSETPSFTSVSVEKLETNETEIIEKCKPEVTSSTLETVVDDVLNDIQFDMLDVSEDIVIGDMCEVKTEKENSDSSMVTVSEDVILDNSQSSMDEAAASDTNEDCKTYDYSADENLRRDSITVSGNADAVLAIECIDNNFIAACLDGNVYYFNSDGKLINTLRGSNLAVTCLTIVKEKYGTTVYTGSLDSRIRYYDLETGMEKGPECNVLSPIQTMDRAWDTVFVGTRTGFVLQFECKNNMLIPVSTVKFSEQSILALRAMKEGPRKVLLVAARSEAVTIKDAQTGLLLRTLEGPKMTVYTLLFEDGKVYCGTSSHQIHVFDYASGSHIGSHEGGKGAVCLRATGGLVFAGCYDGCVYVYREGNPAPLAQLRGPSLMLLSLAVIGTKIIVGYKDRGLYIWKIPLAIVQEMIL